MPISLSIMAPTVAEVTTVEPALVWDCLRSSSGEPVDAQAIAATPQPRFPALYQGLPYVAGVYLWSVDPGGEAAESDRAVIYVGVATGRGGLAGRMEGEFRGIRNQLARTRSPRWRQRYYSGHPRIMLERNARLHYAPITSGGDDFDDAAVATERALLHFCRFATGAVPLVNGSGWWSYGERHDRARTRAWSAIRKGTHLLHEGGPGDDEAGDELLDPGHR